MLAAIFSLRWCYSGQCSLKFPLNPSNQVSLQGFVNKAIESVVMLLCRTRKMKKCSMLKSCCNFLSQKHPILKATCSQLYLSSTGGTVFDIKVTGAQTIVLPGGKGDVFLLICSQGLFSVILGQDFPVTLSTALKYVTVLSYNYSINLTGTSLV